MQVKSFHSPTPHLLLENVFTDEQLEGIWTELDFLYPTLANGSNTAPAKDEDGNILKRNKGRFLYETYVDPAISSIIQSTQIVGFNSGLADHWSAGWMKEIYRRTNWDSILVSYYDDTDYYNPHFDNAMFTMLIWLWKEPKQFTGGNFYFPNVDHLIECKNNCGIVFMSGEKHGVHPIKLNQEGFGRYCISTFSGIANAGPT